MNMFNSNRSTTKISFTNKHFANVQLVQDGKNFAGLFSKQVYKLYEYNK